MEIITEEPILDLVTLANGIPRLRVDHQGRVNIGQDFPTNRLDVEGAATIGVATGTAAPTNGLVVGGQVQMLAGRPQNAVTTTTYTLALTDAGKLVTLNNASAITLTVPTNASVAFAQGVEIELFQIGAGTVTVAAAGGVTINSLSGYVTFAGQYAGAWLTFLGSNTWLLRGDLVTSG